MRDGTLGTPDVKCRTGSGVKTAPHSPESRFSFYPVDPDGSGFLKLGSPVMAGRNKTVGPSGACGQNQWLTIDMPMRLTRSADWQSIDQPRLCRKQVLPLLGRRRGCQIRLLVKLPVRSEITTGPRVVRGDRDRGDGLSCLAAERTWGRLRPASVDHGRWPRGRGGRCMAGGGATSSGAIDGKSPARVDMLPPTTAPAVRRRPACPVVESRPAAPQVFRVGWPPAAAVFPRPGRRCVCRR